jgi:ABC-type arginine transport system permease subunit
MSNADGLVRSRFDRSTATAGLALGDVLVLASFLTMGSLNHGVDPVSMPGRVAGTVAPFLVGWVVASLVAGAYAPDATRTVRTAVLRAVAAWVPAAAIGLTLRSTEFFHGDSPWTFALVVTGVGIVSFSAWRAFAAYVW